MNADWDAVMLSLAKLERDIEAHGVLLAKLRSDQDAVRVRTTAMQVLGDPQAIFTGGARHELRGDE